MIHLFDVTKVYPPRHLALANVNLHIDKGEFIFLTGPSGAGKTSLIKLLLREDTATQGRVMVNGQDVARLRPRQIPYFRRQIGVVFQDFRLLPQKTVFENVAFPLRVTEYSPREIMRRVPSVLEMVGLRDSGRAFPHELSGGEQQRVALARAVVTSPHILIADEPTGNLDPATARGIADLILEVNRHGTTVVMSTHAEYIVNALRKRVVTLASGRVVSDQLVGRYRHEA